MALRNYEPMPRFFHTSAKVDRKVIVHNGWTQDDSVQRLASTVEVFDPHREEWEAKQSTGETPAPGVCGAASTLCQDVLFTYGGVTTDYKYFNSLHKLNAKTYHWCKLTPQNPECEFPMPKECAAMVAFGDNLALVGGYGVPNGSSQRGSSFIKNPRVPHGMGWTNEFHIYHLNEDHRRAVMFGGYNDKEGMMNDVYILDLQMMHWIKLPKSGRGPWPEERSSHAACCLNYGQQHPQLLVTGGVTWELKILGDAWILDVDSRRWRRISDYLQFRYGHSSTAIDISSNLTEVVMFGGSPNYSGIPKLANTTILQFRIKRNSWELSGVVMAAGLAQSKERLREKMEYADICNMLVVPLQRYIRKASPTGHKLGSGTYGSVIELVSAGELVAGKVFKNLSRAHMQQLLERLYGEIVLMMTVHHTNIVESRGVCFLEHPMPVLLMERLMSSLHDYLLHPSHQATQLTAKVSILCDVASGLSYLHNHTPAIIHRDLTARNVLLDSTLKAKIGDFGNARLMDLDPSSTPQTFTSLPGTLEYMPPEASGQHAHYDPSLDVFSLGHLALFTIVQTHIVLLPHSYSDSEGDHLRSELMRRQRSVDRAEQILGETHTLLTLIRGCLHNNAALRPCTEEIAAKLQLVTFAPEAEPSGQTTPSTAGGSVAYPVTHPTPPLQDQPPTMTALTCFKTSSGPIDVAERIGPKYVTFGLQLLEDITGSITDAIELEYHHNAYRINLSILKRWVGGQGRRPLSWATLIAVLRDIQLCELARQIEHNF